MGAAFLAAWIGLAVAPALHGGPWAHASSFSHEPSTDIALDWIASVDELACPVCLAASQARTGLARVATLDAARPEARPLAPTERIDLSPRRVSRSVDAARAPPLA